MRRLLCILALIGRFSGQSYVWRALPLRPPIAIESRIRGDTIHGTSSAWWAAR